MWKRSPRSCSDAIRGSPDRALFVAGAWSRPTGDSAHVRLTLDPRHRLVNPVLYRLEEAEACWSRVQIPMLLITGGHSEHLQRRLKDLPFARLQELLRNLRHVELPRLGHMMHHEDPFAVARPIIEFAREQSA